MANWCALSSSTLRHTRRGTMRTSRSCARGVGEGVAMPAAVRTISTMASRLAGSADRLRGVVVAHTLEQRFADAMHDAPYDLAFDDHRVDLLHQKRHTKTRPRRQGAGVGAQQDVAEREAPQKHGNPLSEVVRPQFLMLAAPIKRHHAVHSITSSARSRIDVGSVCSPCSAPSKTRHQNLPVETPSRSGRSSPKFQHYFGLTREWDVRVLLPPS